MAIVASKKTLPVPANAKNLKSKGISAEIKKNIDTHKKAAGHHEAAAKFHMEAAKHHEAGNHENAHQSAVMASGHSYEAHDLQKEDVKQHALAK